MAVAPKGSPSNPSIFSTGYLLIPLFLVNPCRKNVSGARQLPARRQMSVVAMATAPRGVTQPRQKPVQPPPAFGFVDNAERINSRAAMVSYP